MITTRLGLFQFEKILLSESVAHRSSNWASFQQIFLWDTSKLVNILRANFNYIFIDLSNVKVLFLKR